MTTGLSTDNQAQAKVGAVFVVMLVVVGFATVFLMPSVINEFNGAANQSITQDTTETVEVNGKLNATLDSTDTTADSATYTLNVTDGGSTTKTIDNGTTATFSFNRGDVDVTVTNVESGNATANFVYPKDFAFSDASRSLWGIIPAMMLLTVFVFIVGVAIKAID